MVRPRQRGGFTRAPRRAMIWLDLNSTTSTLGAATNSSLQTTLNAAALALRPFTVIRSRGLIHLGSDQAAASEFQDVALGRIVVREEAAAIGVTALP